MEDIAAILALQSREDWLASVNFNENGWTNLDQSSDLSNANSLRINETGTLRRYLKIKSKILIQNANNLGTKHNGKNCNLTKKG